MTEPDYLELLHRGARPMTLREWTLYTEELENALRCLMAVRGSLMETNRLLIARLEPHEPRNHVRHAVSVPAPAEASLERASRRIETERLIDQSYSAASLYEPYTMETAFPLTAPQPEVAECEAYNNLDGSKSCVTCGTTWDQDERFTCGRAG